VEEAAAAIQKALAEQANDVIDEIEADDLKDKVLPTHHLPWAGFGLRQPHWLILKCDVEKSRTH